jgi:hypothetical protein
MAEPPEAWRSLCQCRSAVKAGKAESYAAMPGVPAPVAEHPVP